MRTNNESNKIIKWIVMAGDFALLNVIIFACSWHSWSMNNWPNRSLEIFMLVNNLALVLAQSRYSTIIHLRMVGAGDILQRVMGLTVMQTVIAYILLRVFDYHLPVGWLQLWIGIVFLLLLLVKRLAERWGVKWFRQMGGNSRSVTFIGNDPELMTIYEKLVTDPTRGYRVRGYYADEEIGHWTYSNASDGSRRLVDTKGSEPAENGQRVDIKQLGTLQDFLRMIREEPDELRLGDELYVSLSRRDKDIIKRISRFCDHRMIRFFYVPVSVESIGLSLRREMLDDIEIFTTYENPLQNPVNRFAKRMFDIVLSLFFLIPTALMFPFIWLIIKIQSPGPVFFKQARTGLDGRTFMMLKFRSMHVNKDADRLQATKNDPRKYPFGNFMRKSNIDELPQFLNVLKGDMSFVGPRPHMLAHTEQYSALIDQYMVRHFVKPGLTGWAQVTGFRGETKELWQMEGRVKRDIWYMENWSIWLDIRIIWLTAKTIFIHDKNAY